MGLEVRGVADSARGGGYLVRGRLRGRGRGRG